MPAVVEYIPYRKRDDTRWRDEPMHGYFAGHGYAAVRVDVRGSGTSDGVLLDEYSDEEWQDGLAALDWIARQPWCDGRVGLMGKSWGGINALQLAALRPAALKCVISVCSTDDRWATDAHWMGGCLLAENLTWGSVLQTLAVRPQDPELVGDAWRETWLRRIREVPLFVARWLRHDTRDDYWARGSVCESYQRIEVPVLAVGGWADAYADTVPRLLAGLSTPRSGWVGPWAHVYPHNGVPGPAAGFLQVALSWWDRWLREKADGWSERGFRVWMGRGGAAPRDTGVAEGRWVAEEGWPSGRTRPTEHRLGAPGTSEVTVPWTVAGAVAAGAWCPFGVVDVPDDQSPDDEVSALFDLPVLDEPLELLGAPEVELSIASNRAHGMVAVRLCDVDSQGRSTRVSYGLLDLTFRDGFGERRPLEPGRTYRVRVPLRHCAHSFGKGRRVRLAISTSYWPVAWPCREPFRLTLWPADSLLRLPVRPPHAGDADLVPPPPPEAAPSADAAEDASPTRMVLRDAKTGVLTAIVRQGWGDDGEPLLTAVEPIGLDSGWGIEERFELHPDDPAAARAAIRHVTVSRRGGWAARVELTLEQWRTPVGFGVRCEMVATEGGEEVARRVMEEEIPTAG